MSTQEYIGELAKAVMNGPDEEFVLEALGILGNLTVADVNFQALLTDYDMLNYIKTKLQPGEWQVLYHLPRNVINWEGRKGGERRCMWMVRLAHPVGINLQSRGISRNTASYSLPR